MSFLGAADLTGVVELAYDASYLCQREMIGTDDGKASGDVSRDSKQDASNSSRYPGTGNLALYSSYF